MEKQDKERVLLLLFTFGIWQLVWVYKTTGYLNQAKGEEYRSPTSKLLLYMFVPFYSIYWIYKSAQRIDKMAAEKGLNSELSTLCLILAIFIPFIALILMQDKINAIATANGTSQGAGTSALKNGSQLDAADELKKYKAVFPAGKSVLRRRSGYHCRRRAAKGQSNGQGICPVEIT